MTEQEILDQFFHPRLNRTAEGVVLGSGDDCALLQPQPGEVLAVTTDTLVENVHFFSATDPYSIGYKSVAVNLSDLAAMGATPRWILLALTFPQVDREWLQGFSEGMYACLKAWNVALVGGNLARGPLVITFTALGVLPIGKGVKRSGAQAGDMVAVTGRIGEAALAFRLLQQKEKNIPPTCLNRLHRPEPRVALGQALLEIATSMIDVTDGLTKDCERLAKASGLGMELFSSQIPLPEGVMASLLSTERLNDFISFGDDYELCFTLSSANVHHLQRLEREHGIPVRVIGSMRSDQQLLLTNAQGHSISFAGWGFDHFRNRTESQE